MVMRCVGMVLAAVYHEPLRIAGIVLMLAGIWMTWVRKSRSGPHGMNTGG